MQAPGWMGRLLSFAAGAVLLVVAFMASLLVFALVVAVALVVGVYLWWKTRELRRQVREMQRPARGGRVVEGDAIRDVGSEDGDRG
ncbi:MAG: hypothetical protein HY778_03080 [Betaproteobacteria bacterium]|nr:hypothetical protein [Betaproteobacteria bacterium]